MIVLLSHTVQTHITIVIRCNIISQVNVNKLQHNESGIQHSTNSIATHIKYKRQHNKSGVHHNG